MSYIERRRQELKSYYAERTLDDEQLELYWSKALNRSAAAPLRIARENAHTPLPNVSADRLTYFSSDGTPIHCWFLVPHAAQSGGQVPCVVIFQGYTGDKGLPERYALWLMLGYAVLAVDARGQSGETGIGAVQEAGAAKGWVSQGILDVENSYYAGLSIDAIRAVDAAASQPEVDDGKIAVVGGSQGGGLALIAAALNSKVSAVVADIPNLCHMDFGILNSTGSLTELALYVKRYPEHLDKVLRAIAHFDMLNLADRITAPVLLSVGWKDTVCTPETIYAVYNRINSYKLINDYPFSGHEVNEYQKREGIKFLQSQFGGEKQLNL